MPAPALCYLCNHAADTTPPPGEAPLCRRCVVDELAAETERWGGYDAEFADETTDPGVGPPLDMTDDIQVYPRPTPAPTSAQNAGIRNVRYALPRKPGTCRGCKRPTTACICF